MTFPEPFSVSRSALLTTLLQSPSKSWQIWCAGAIGLILIIIGCFGDFRFLVLGLMICVAIVPAILAFLYFSYSLSPQIVANLLPHTLETLHDGYLLHIWKQEDLEDDTEESHRWSESYTIRLYSSDIETTKSTFDYDILFFSPTSPLHLLFLPKNLTTSQLHNTSTSTCVS